MITALREYYKKRDRAFDRFKYLTRGTGFDNQGIENTLKLEFLNDFIKELAMTYDANPILRETWSNALKTVCNKVEEIKTLNKQPVTEAPADT